MKQVHFVLSLYLGNPVLNPGLAHETASNPTDQRIKCLAVVSSNENGVRYLGPP